MAGPRTYSSGTVHALFRLAAGTCYFPDCLVPVLADADGEPIVGVDVAHIRGALPSSARYDPDMTDQQRAAFANLILLCTVHHKLVDRVRPDDYPVELLNEWKSTNEPPGGLEELRRMDGLDATNLERLIEDAVRRTGPIRRVEVDIAAGLLINGSEALASTFDAFAILQEHNPHLDAQPRVVVVSVRNVGESAVEVEGIDLWFVYPLEGHEDSKASLMGRNDYPGSNPSMPFRVATGAALRWFTSRETVAMISKGVAGQTPSGLYASARLSTGEVVDSPRVPWDDVLAAKFG